MTAPPKSVLVLNGPNLNLLGTREPSFYGAQTLADVEALCCDACETHGFTLDFRQSNHEGVLIDLIHAAGVAQAAGTLAGVVFNAGAYTHTSIALHDAIKGASVHLIELHISNVHARESFRHHSWISPVAHGVMAGFGIQGYGLAIAALALQPATASSQ
ncbi:type II 3-dehydroquinate dehydratase [Glaciimonas sp. PCH181]|uniref:type II 3-dehydroquinate dehydratase n=1 Tax=Glaciimonas sp. PCH181 TaxID=2133943 RepID=UPI000D3D0318|nr:type II 3-dehydroquinate dehydratase [Glaciimonas sp. PCH181]PUA16597.1 type II 3-dehydroquinate dehydratase [Glaciimonas sp. PCH181]